MADVQKPVGDNIQTPKKAKGVTRTPGSAAKSASAKKQGLSQQAKDASGQQTPTKKAWSHNDVNYSAKKAGGEAKQGVENAKDSAQDQAKEAMPNGVADQTSKTQGDQESDVQDAVKTGEEQVSGAQSEGENVAEDTEQQATDAAQDATQGAQETTENATEDVENQTQDAQQAGEDAAGEAAETAQDQGQEVQDETADAAQNAQDQTGAEGDDDEGDDVVPIGTVQKDGSIVDEDGNVIGQLSEGNAEELEGNTVDQQGDVLDDDGNVVGKAEPNDEGRIEEDDDQGETQEAGKDATEAAGDLTDQAKEAAENAANNVPQPEFTGALKANDNGEIVDDDGNVIANLSKDDIKSVKDKEIDNIDQDGNLLDKDGNNIGKASLTEEQTQNLEEQRKKLEGDAQETAEDQAATGEGDQQDGEQAEAEGQDQADAQGDDEEEEPLDYSLIDGKQVNKAGNVVDENGEIVGRLVEGDPKKLAGKTCAEDGKIWDNKGKVLGRAEPLRASEREPQEEAGPFEDFPGAIVERSGDVTYEGKKIGKVVEGELKKLEGKQVDSDGDIADKNGNTIGRAERLEDEPEEEEPQTDYSILEGLTVNKAGNVVDNKGNLVGRVVEGEIKKLANRKIYEGGQVWNDSGKVIGRVEPIPEDERVEEEGDAPFEDYPDSVVQKNGDVLYEGTKIGEVVEGDPKKLAGKKVDADGDIVDRHGTAVGKAERWEEPEAEPEPEVDNSALAGKRVNKIGNVVDEHGSIYGKLVEGNAKSLAGKMCDKKGNVWDEGGNVVGRAELVPESERAGSKEGPFTDYQPCTVTKEGKVVFGDQVVGRLVTGDPKNLAGRHVDEDGEVIDANGNSIARAERWEEPEEEKFQHPCQGLKVNKDGNVIDGNGNTIAKLTEGTASRCSGQKIDEDGNVVDGKGRSIGFVTMLEDIPEAEKSQEEIEEEKKAQQDKELANRMSSVIEDSIEKIKPVLKEMTDLIEEAERTPEKDRDEEKLVEQVKPLIEKGGNILQETNGAIRGMDPDGRIQSKAKQKTKSGEGTPEEYRLADLLKQLSGDVSETIDKCKKKISGMPHAKSELNPLWGLLQEPLFQILAAVGLLLSGVLGLVGKLLGGLGLGGLVDGLLGGLGLNKIVDSLGIF